DKAAEQAFRPTALMHRLVASAVLPFGKSVDADIVKSQAFIQGRDIGLIARNAVERLGYNQIKFSGACVAEDLIDTGAVDGRRAADSVVGVDLDNLASQLLGALAAHAQLILDGSLVLAVTGIAGI